MLKRLDERNKDYATLFQIQFAENCITVAKGQAMCVSMQQHCSESSTSNNLGEQ